METSNPLPQFENPHVLLDGTYEAVLRGCEVIERPKFDDPMVSEPALRFLFEVPSEQVVLGKIDNLKFGSKSNLSRDLRQLMGPKFGRHVFNNRDTLWAHIESLFGRSCTIVCEPSETGAYTKITAIAPATNGAPAVKRKANGTHRLKHADEAVVY
jgi:hypothetical protein